MIVAAGGAATSINQNESALTEVPPMLSCFALTFDTLLIFAAYALVFAIGLGLGMWKRG
jgi:hypothetical protein